MSDTKTCKNGTDCRNLLGPELPATDDFFYRYKTGTLSGKCLTCRRNQRKVYIRDLRAGRIGVKSREPAPQASRDPETGRLLPYWKQLDEEGLDGSWWQVSK